MGSRGRRKRIAKGIYEDRYGRSGIVSIRGEPKELRFPPYTPLKTIREGMDDYKRKHRGSGRVATARGTLAHAVDAWEGQETHLASWRERRAELRAWVALYGDVRLSALDAEDIRRAIGIWTVAKVAPKTIRNRLWSLKHLYKITLGPDAETPVDHVSPPAKVRHVINPTPVETILTVYRNLLQMETHEGYTVNGKTHRLRDAKTRARFMVRASTGRRPCEIMRAQPDDVDLSLRTWRVRDAKGGWSEGIYLNDDMLVAWRVFAAAKAWGDFNTGSQAEVVRAAGWPSERDARGRYTSRPYNLRHSVGIALGELGHDLADIGAQLGQTDIQTTRSHYVPILNSRMQRMSEAMAGRLSGWVVEPDILKDA